MKIPPFLVGVWKDDEEDTAEAPAAPAPAAGPAAPAAPPKPAHPPKVFVPTYNGRPIPAGPIGGARYPLPGQTVNLDPATCKHPRNRAEQDPTTYELTALVCDDCGHRGPAPAADPTPPPAAGPAPAGPVTKEDGDAEEEDVEDAEEEGEEGGEEPGEGGEQPQSRGQRIRGRASGWKAPSFPRPVNSDPAPRAALIDRLRVMTVERWGVIYNGAAAFVGWKIGLVGWATNTTLYIDLRADEWGDTAAICGYAFAAALLLLDRRYKGRFILLAFAARIPTISVLLGVLLYGGTSAF
ncbi:hypothetical protein [Streptomyces sp. G1]|uniref:hypothetical protein n=1 Tax=Streptomyces sp. G1 TaxID=361572 RepID=UPI0020301181|nr:hypothetical protein [Streptomyces sp. G1]MCM1964880.1 hypothetical protein [Streptomyces sp. G1]